MRARGDSHSGWAYEAAFEAHAKLPDTSRRVKRMGRLIDHAFDAARVPQN
jgi:hypothetical protein